jgi:glutamate N-acetyltransferase/amino-acid N-acetyltransferase
MLKKALAMDAEDSFHQLCIDGDTSTNDMAAILANGFAGNEEIASGGQEFEQFCMALRAVTVQLCKQLAKDGEGATKLIECIVSDAPGKDAARKIAKSVISSSLLKAAVYAEDANWSRILSAVGNADTEFDISKVDITISSKNGAIQICEDGLHKQFKEKTAAKVLSAGEIKILISLKEGEESAAAWGCDLTYEYVKINGDYRLYKSYRA